MKTKTPKTLIKNIPQIIGYFSQVSTRFNFGVELLHGSIFEDEDALFEVVYPPDLNPAITAQRLFSVYNEITKSDKWLAHGCNEPRPKGNIHPNWLQPIGGLTRRTSLRR